jgi:hypothetical protein
MLLVTGTFRSGTSMWMQVLQAAGFPVIGSAYPAHWGQALGAFNQRGFFESRLRSGIWWRTNPNPETGAYLFPEQTQRHLVKVFVDGLVRTDVAFVDHVVVTMRDWRSYSRSFGDIRQTERAWFEEQGLPFPSDDKTLPPPYQWWRQNYDLVRDIATRRHQASFTTYDHVLRAPKACITQILDRLEVVDPARRAAAIACIEPSLHTPRPVHPSEAMVPPEDAAVFDLLFTTVDQGHPIGPELIEEMNALQERLQPRLEELRAWNQAHERQTAKS